MEDHRIPQQIGPPLIGTWGARPPDRQRETPAAAETPRRGRGGDAPLVPDERRSVKANQPVRHDANDDPPRAGLIRPSEAGRAILVEDAGGRRAGAPAGANTTRRPPDAPLPSGWPDGQGT